MIRYKKLFLFSASVPVLFTMIIILFFYSPNPLSAIIRIKIKEHIENYFKNISIKLESGTDIGKCDSIVLKTLYRLMVLYSNIVYPEAAAILNHYIRGDNYSPQVSSTFFKNSPVVKTAIRNKANCTVGPIALYINQDRRLAYAFNRFYIKITGDSTKTNYELFQIIEFDKIKGGHDFYTTFYLGKFSFSMKDNLIRAFEKSGGCKPFKAFCTWSVKIK